VLTFQPDIISADELVSNLSPKTNNIITRLMKNLNEKESATLYDLMIDGKIGVTLKLIRPGLF